VRLLHAVIAVESDYDAKAVSPKGAQGLMQLMPATAQRFGVANPFDPRENVRGGALYLKWLLDLFGGDLQLAIAGYNAGEQAVIRAGYRVPPYAETQKYVPRVMSRLQRAVPS
jgi:soluble lytic murein transglycosylase-like protein